VLRQTIKRGRPKLECALPKAPAQQIDHGG